MRKSFCLLGAPMLIGMLMLASLFLPSMASAQSRVPAFTLPHSPLSTSLLVAQGIHQGTIKLPTAPGGKGPNNPALTCSPAPCVLPNVQASGGNGTNIVNEDPIAASPTNAQDLLTGGNDYNCTSLQGFYSSSNGGTSWTSTCMSTLSGAFGDGDPGVGYDLNGNSYITGIDGGTADGYDIVYEKSSNNGSTWSAPAVAVKPLFSGGLTDKDWLQVDDSASSPYKNSLYISVTQFNGPETQDTISVSHSSNGGSTWTTKQVDTTQTLTSEVDQFSDLAIAKNGTVYATWLRCPPTGPTGDCGGTTSKMYMSDSTNGGNTWSTPVVVATVKLAPDTAGCCYYGQLPNTDERVSDIPAIDVDRSSGAHAGNLYVVLYTWTGTYMKVEVTTSTNGGSTWSTPVPVAPSTDTHDQFFPWLTVSSSGIVGVTWLDRRNDPSNLSYEAYATASLNGGTSFVKNFQLASAPSNPDNDGFGGSFMGDYTGNYWDGKTLYASWMDTRNGVNCQDFVGGLLS